MMNFVNVCETATLDRITAELDAVQDNDEELMRLLLHSRRYNAQTPVHVLCKYGRLHALQEVLVRCTREQGMELLRACTSDGNTPLHEACINMDKGATMNIRNLVLFILTRACTNDEAFELLSTPNQRGETPFFVLPFELMIHDLSSMFQTQWRSLMATSTHRGETILLRLARQEKWGTMMNVMRVWCPPDLVMEMMGRGTRVEGYTPMHYICSNINPLREALFHRFTASSTRVKRQHPVADMFSFPALEQLLQRRDCNGRTPWDTLLDAHNEYPYTNGRERMQIIEAMLKETGERALDVRKLKPISDFQLLTLMGGTYYASQSKREPNRRMKDMIYRMEVLKRMWMRREFYWRLRAVQQLYAKIVQFHIS
jgi:hypothetical protein